MPPDQFPIDNPLAPWHLWGNEQSFVTTGATQSGQLARINYHRPETWRFLFVLSWFDSIQNGDFIAARFKVITGIGLTSTKLDPFTIIRVDGPQPRNQMAWQTTVRQPNFEAGATAMTTDIIVGQDIQCDCEVLEGLSIPVHLTVSAMFAPNTHLRPDWFARRFNNGELGGT